MNTHTQRRRIFTATSDGFQLDGKKFHVYAGEIHYFRIASCRWQDRLRKLRRVGLNTVSTAIEWAMHEPKPENYRWSGDANFSRFIELAQDLNLLVIVRAGPFIDADRDLGGLPRWLLSTNLSRSENRVRGHNSEYRYYVKRWLSFLLPKLAEKTISNGGPIIMFQIDSDLGDSPVCGTNKWLYDIFVTYFGKDTVLFTMDQNHYQNIICGRIDGALPAFRTNPLEYTISFNNTVGELFAPLRKTFPDFPKLVELRCGTTWFWGGRRIRYDLGDFTDTLVDILAYDSSVILYMFAGGSNFERAGFWEIDMTAMTTSYDYDAPLNEAGDLTDKYFRLKSIFAERGGDFVNYQDDLEEVEEQDRALYGKPSFTCVGSLLDPNIRKDLRVLTVYSQEPLVFSAISARPVDMVLYETVVPINFSTDNRKVLEVHSLGIRDRGYVYIGRSLVGIMNYVRHTITTNVFVVPGYTTIQILVESQGHRTRLAFSDRKGIVSDIYLNDFGLKNWTMFAFPFDDVGSLQSIVKRMRKRCSGKRGGCLCRASFVAPKNVIEPKDSFLDVSLLGKGQVFLNEHSLGKYWSTAGPQQSLYVPGCFVKPYPLMNHLLVVELLRQQKRKIRYDFLPSRRKMNYETSSGEQLYDSGVFVIVACCLFAFLDYLKFLFL